jgi:hypothetical protein
MKIKMLTESTRRLAEDLGNLAQLKLGNLIGLLKQDRHSGVGKQFQKGAHYGPGNTSDIVDVGVLKNGIQGLRKAYRSHEIENNVFVGFAVYLNGKAVAFGLYDADKLAGRTREGEFAYDLSGFEAQIDAAHEKENAERQKWNQTRKMAPTSAYDKEDRIYPRGYGQDSEKIIRKFVGGSESTNDLAAFLDKLQQIADLIDGTITLKLVTADRKGSLRGQARRQARPEEFDMRTAAENLKVRLARFKNAKRPTAENIHQFLKMATDQAASVVNFDGEPWSTKVGKGYGSDLDPVALMNGKPFALEYKNADPKSYNSLKISYRYDKRDNQIRPWQAQWTSKDYRSKTVVMDPEYWIKATLGVDDLEKPTVIKNMLTKIKDKPGEGTFNTIEKSIAAMRDLGADWPEFAIIEKSLAAERAKAEKK